MRLFILGLAVALLVPASSADNTVPPEAQSQYDKAEVAREEGRLEEAASLYLMAIGVHPLYRQAHLGYLATLRGLSDKDATKAGRALYERLVGEHAATVELRAFLASLLPGEERIPALNAVAKEHPENVQAWIELGRAHLAVGERQSLRTAERALKEAIKLEDKLVAAHVLLGDVYLQGGKASTARKQYQAALDVDGDYTPALLRMALCWHRLKKGKQKALPLLGRLVSEENLPRLVAGWWLIALINVDLNNNDEALKAIETVLTIDKEDLQALIARGHILLRSGKPAEAARVFQQAVEKHPKAADAWYAWFCLGWAQEQAADAPEIQDAKKKERLAAAADAYEESAKLKHEVRPRDSLGFVYLLGERHGDAVKQFQVAGDMDPGFAPARNNLGLSADMADNRAQAKRKYEEVLKKIDKLNVRAMVMLALDFWLDGSIPKATKQLGKALKIAPDDDLAWTFLGDIWAEAKREKKALRCYRKAVELNQKNFTAWFHMGKLLEEDKKHEEADKCYRKAMEAKADPPADLPLRLAVVNDDEGLDRLEESLKYYQLYLDLGGTLEWVQDRIEELKEEIGKGKK